MEANNFFTAAREGKVTPDMLRELLSLPKDAIAIAFRDLASHVAVFSSGCMGLQKDFESMIIEIDSPELMLMYVKYYIKNAYRRGYIYPALDVSELRWVMEDLEFSIANQIMTEYLSISTLKLLPDAQQMLYNSKHTPWFELMVKHHKLDPKLQKQIIDDYNLSVPTNERNVEVRKNLSSYIENRKFSSEVEIMFMKNSNVNEFKARYVELHGLNERTRDIMIFDTWSKCQRITL